MQFFSWHNFSKEEVHRLILTLQTQGLFMFVRLSKLFECNWKECIQKKHNVNDNSGIKQKKTFTLIVSSTVFYFKIIQHWRLCRKHLLSKSNITIFILFDAFFLSRNIIRHFLLHLFVHSWEFYSISIVIHFELLFCCENKKMRDELEFYVMYRQTI